MKRGLAFTIVTLALMEILARADHGIGFPGPFWEIAVVHAAMVEGMLSGLLSAALTIGYAVYSLAIPGKLIAYTDEAAQRLITQAIAGPVLAILVGYLRHHRPPGGSD